MVPTVARVTLPNACAALRIGPGRHRRRLPSCRRPARSHPAAPAGPSCRSGQTVVVGDSERDVQHAFLHIVEVEHPRQQQGPISVTWRAPDAPAREHVQNTVENWSGWKLRPYRRPV